MYLSNIIGVITYVFACVFKIASKRRENIWNKIKNIRFDILRCLTCFSLKQKHFYVGKKTNIISCLSKKHCHRFWCESMYHEHLPLFEKTLIEQNEILSLKEYNIDKNRG